MRRENKSDRCALPDIWYPETKVIDPIRDNLSSCTMPLSCTTPMTVTSAIMHNQECARDYLEHGSMVRDLLEQSSITPSYAVLSATNNRLHQSLSGPLTGSSTLAITREPIRVWDLACESRLCSDSESVRHCKGGRQVKDSGVPATEDPDEKREQVRQVCVTRYLVP